MIRIACLIIIFVVVMKSMWKWKPMHKRIEENDRSTSFVKSDRWLREHPEDRRKIL